MMTVCFAKGQLHVTVASHSYEDPALVLDMSQLESGQWAGHGQVAKMCLESYQ
jgi:hypothetical protein